jgi:hypothetical protein
MSRAITLEQDESLLFEEGASHFHNFIAVGGHLRLTNRRIIFESIACNYKHVLSIDISQVAEVEFFKTMFMNPNGLAVMIRCIAHVEGRGT